MRNVLSLLIVCHLACLAPSAMALGFGRIDSATVLGQRLDFASQVSVEPQDALTESCVSAEVTAGDNRLAPEQVQVRVTGASTATQKTVRVTTTVGIDEPVVSVNLTIGCVSRVSRRFVVFADPPLINLVRAEPLVAAPAPAAAEGNGRPPASTTATVPPAAAPLDTPAATMAAADPGRAPATSDSATRSDPPRRAPPRRSSEPARPRPVASAAPAAVRQAPAAMATPSATPSARTVPARTIARAPVRTTPPPAATASAVVPAAGGRLTLEAATPVATQPTAAASAASAVVAAAAALPTASAASAVAADAPVRALEADLQRLRERDLAMQRSIATLESRLKELEASRSPDPWLSVLAVMAALLALIGVAWLWLRSRAAGPGAWWNPTPAEAAQAAVAAPAAPVSRSFAASEIGDGVVDDEDEPSDRFDDDSSGTATGSFAMTLPGEPLLDDSTGSHPRGEIGVEELFDLEQQADFFLALGQDEAAIDLLLGHARGSGASSPMPYLKLIEIYRQRGDREGYESTRTRFNRRFNALIGEWDQPGSEGQAFEDRPEMLTPLLRDWPDSAAAVRLLEAWIWRGSAAAEPRIDLAAYRDVLFLYTVARDLLDRSGQVDRVDLALPLLEGGSGASHVAQLMASTIPMRVQEEHGHALDAGIVPDIDISEAPPDAPSLPTLPDAAEPPVQAPADKAGSPASNEIEFKLSSDFMRLDLPADPPSDPKAEPKP